MGYNYVRRKNKVEFFNIELLIVHIYQRGVSIFKEELKEISCRGGLQSSYIETLNRIDQSGANVGIEQNMKDRYLKYRGDE